MKEFIVDKKQSLKEFTENTYAQGSFFWTPAFYCIYEDENLLIIDKESGVNSEAVYSALKEEKECYFIHRLDRNTKGLLVFALNKKTEKAAKTAFSCFLG